MLPNWGRGSCGRLSMDLWVWRLLRFRKYLLNIFSSSRRDRRALLAYGLAEHFPGWGEAGIFSLEVRVRTTQPRRKTGWHSLSSRVEDIQTCDLVILLGKCSASGDV